MGKFQLLRSWKLNKLFKSKILELNIKQSNFSSFSMFTVKTSFRKHKSSKMIKNLRSTVALLLRIVIIIVFIFVYVFHYFHATVRLLRKSGATEKIVLH